MRSDRIIMKIGQEIDRTGGTIADSKSPLRWTTIRRPGDPSAKPKETSRLTYAEWERYQELRSKDVAHS